MKRFLALLLVVCLTTTGCSQLLGKDTASQSQPGYFTITAPAQAIDDPTVPETESQTAPASEPVVEPVVLPEPETEAPTEPAVSYFHPLNGTILDEPFTGRIIGVCISNLNEALPHANVINADLYFESFVNDSIVRGFALFTDVSGLDKIGAVRSNRFMFNDIAALYDAIIAHAGGSDPVLSDANTRNLDHFNIELWGNIDITSFRDQERAAKGYDYEHRLFAKGPGLVEWSQTNNFRMTTDPDKDYYFRFQDDGTPQDGVKADDFTVTITFRDNRKDTRMVYDSALGKYVYNQYGKAMVDDITGEPEAFTNVLILCGEMFYYSYAYERINFTLGGEGWYACGGKAVPVTWCSYSDTEPISVRTLDGAPLVMGRGNTYIALTQNGSKIVGIGE